MIWDKAWLQFGFRWVLCPLVAVAVVVDLVLLNRWQFKNYSYTVTPRFVYVARGRLFRQSMTLSAAQILNVEIRRGPILSRFDLAEVHFTMVVDTEPLGPVTWPEALRIRDLVLGEPVEAVEERDGEG
jgi:membrane protein YdbS with pleckstrin-like domain